MLGEFRPESLHFSAALELKSPATNLDLPQAGYANETPVEQGFYYGMRILGVRWVLVSDMRLIRLYSVESDGEYEEFDLRQCTEEDAFRRLYFLLSRECLIQNLEESQVRLLYLKSTGRQTEIRDTFYQLYYQIRADLFDAIDAAAKSLVSVPSRNDLLQATQRLLDRLLFIYYCEDHPQQLIPDDTTARVTAAARSLPGSSECKVYTALKDLFREIDRGSPPASGLRVAGYNGELFKLHPIIDHIDLPDSLHDKIYHAIGSRNKARMCKGVWGLHEYNFWSELNEHLLGHIFEESLSDLQELGASSEMSLHEKLLERKKGGIFFTTSILSDFLSGSAINAILDERAPLTTGSPDPGEPLRARLRQLLSLRVVDFACGSGAFLVSAYRLLLSEFWRLRTSLGSLAAASGAAPDLFEHQEAIGQASLLRDCLAGVDCLPQAVEIAKLALWLRSAKKGEKVPDLSASMIAADSLRVASTFDLLHAGAGSFDLVLGNPPWGGQAEPSAYAEAVSALGLSTEEKWDSWELFVALGIRALREGGRLALVLPDSLLYPQKSRIRRAIFDSCQVEKLHNLGPDWFGKDVRMGTVILQARRGPARREAQILCAVVAGKLREDAIRGEVPLSQIESQRARLVPSDRVLDSETREIEVFRGIKDDEIIDALLRRSLRLEDVCERGRGEEMNKAGILWQCPSCLSPTTPGKKKKGGGLEDKKCPKCAFLIRTGVAQETTLVTDSQPAPGSAVGFIDGGDICRRYHRVLPNKWLHLDLSGWEYKPASLYRSPKVLLRQAGVGLFATIDNTDARCPQSVYIYRLLQERQLAGYSHEFILGAMLSRTMAFCVFKRFGEVDPAKAHAKLTHERLADLPIPEVDFADPRQRNLHGTVTASVLALLDGNERIGGAADREIERSLRELWGISPQDGAYINAEFYDLPDGQAIRDLFPEGRPRPESFAV
jgi:hypothetical protein